MNRQATLPFAILRIIHTTKGRRWRRGSWGWQEAGLGVALHAGLGSLFLFCCECLFERNAKFRRTAPAQRKTARREIDQIGQKFLFHLAPPSSSLDNIPTSHKYVSQIDFIEQFDREYSDLDIVDRREIKNLDGENLWRYIAKSDVPLAWPPFAGVSDLFDIFQDDV